MKWWRMNGRSRRDSLILHYGNWLWQCGFICILSRASSHFPWLIYINLECASLNRVWLGWFEEYLDGLNPSLIRPLPIPAPLSLSLSLSLFLAGSLDRWQVNSQIRRGFLLRVTELVRDTYPYSKWPRFNPTIVALYRKQSIEFICLVPSQDVIGLDSIPGTIDRLMVGLAA